MTTGMAWLSLAGALALVALNGFFVAVEFTIVTARRSRIEPLVAAGNTAARLVLKLMDSPDRAIAASQLGITMASLALGWIGEATVAALILPPLQALLGRWSLAAAHSIGIAVAFALVTFLHIVLGEQVPKTVAIRYAERTALTVARPMHAFIRVFRPLIAVLDGATLAVVRLLRMQPISGHTTVYTLDELKLIVRQSQQGGALEAQQEQLLQKAFQFGDRQVGEVMVPRSDIVGVEKGATVGDLLALFREVSHARFPVYEQDLDQIVGVVSIKDVLRVLAEDVTPMQTPVGSLARPAVFVPETVAVGDLLARLRATRSQMAIVLDEYGGTAGIVTLEELLEELVGQVSDEQVHAEEPVVRLDDKTAEIEAQLRVDEVNEQLGLQLPEGEDYETVAGLILYRLQRIPAVGEEVHFKGLVLKVARMRGQKIERVQIRRAG